MTSCRLVTSVRLCVPILSCTKAVRAGCTFRFGVLWWLGGWFYSSHPGLRASRCLGPGVLTPEEASIPCGWWGEVCAPSSLLGAAPASPAWCAARRLCIPADCVVCGSRSPISSLAGVLKPHAQLAAPQGWEWGCAVACAAQSRFQIPPECLFHGSASQKSAPGPGHMGSFCP